MPMLYAHSSFWTEQDTNIMQQMNNVRAMLRHAEENHELVKGVKEKCDEAGLLEKDYLMVLVCNLIEKYDEHLNVIVQQNKTLTDSQATLVRAKAVLESPPSSRKVVQVLNYPTTDNPNQKFTVLCDDGTMWMHGGDFGWGCINAATIS